MESTAPMEPLPKACSPAKEKLVVGLAEQRPNVGQDIGRAVGELLWIAHGLAEVDKPLCGPGRLLRSKRPALAVFRIRVASTARRAVSSRRAQGAATVRPRR